MHSRSNVEENRPGAWDRVRYEKDGIKIRRRVVSLLTAEESFVYKDGKEKKRKENLKKNGVLEQSKS